MVKKNFSDDSFDKIFDVEYIKNSIKKDSFTTYILIGLLVFGILIYMITIFLIKYKKKKKIIIFLYN